MRDLAQELKARIELRHIQVRDEAKIVGGIGTCGRELCCTTWMREFVPISMKMAKQQNLSLNPSKISGQCTRRCVAGEDREQIKDEQAALVDALCRRDTMEMLYLMEMWYRDVLVYSATGDAELVLNKDQLALLQSAGVSKPEGKIGAVEKARLYLERFLNEERVFRDLFFALAN